MINVLASVGMCWQASAERAGATWSAAERPAGNAAATKRAAAAASARVHGTDLPAAVVRLRGDSFAIRPRGTPPV